ncbi:MAG TPA: CHRD domain-containing protein [Vicinamibacterales bacterium]
MKALRVVLAIVVTVFVSVPVLGSGEHTDRLQATLIGYQEVPSVSSPATGEFHATIAADQLSIDYEETFSGLIGTVQQSHIHFGQRGVSGSVVVWLCQTTTTPAPAAVAGITPFCPQSGKVSGTITAANVITASTASQQIVAGELAEVIAAIRAGFAYANVHSTPLNPAGEIRGQIRVLEQGDKDR